MSRSRQLQCQILRGKKVADKVLENIFEGEADEYCEQRVFADILDTHIGVALAQARRSKCTCSS